MTHFILGQLLTPELGRRKGECRRSQLPSQTAARWRGEKRRSSFVAILTLRKLAPHLRCNRGTPSSCPSPTASQHNTPQYQASVVKSQSLAMVSRRLRSAVTWDRVGGASDWIVSKLGCKNPHSSQCKVASGSEKKRSSVHTHTKARQHT